MLIFERLLKVFKNFELTDIDTSGITMDTTLMGDLGISSIEFVMMACDIEKEFGIEIEFSVIPRIVTVGDSCRYIEELLKK